MGLVRSGAEDRCGISHVATTGSPRFLGDPSCTFALFSDPGRAPLSPYPRIADREMLPPHPTKRRPQR
jgi:hypothetical protein